MASSVRGNKLKDARVLILGGSSGLGFSVAETLVEAGAQVVISSSTQSKVDHAVSRLQDTYPEKKSSIVGYSCDLSKRADLEPSLTELFDKVVAGGSKIDHVVFTAGEVYAIKPLAETSVDEILNNGTVRFFGPLVMGKIAPKYLNRDSNSSITLTGGTMSQRPLKDWTVQAAWGSGVEGIARGLAVDLAPIRVNIVSPSAVDTELFSGIPPEARDGVIKRYSAMSVLDRVGSAEEAAEPYIYSIRSTFTTGTVIVMDGGRCVK